VEAEHSEFLRGADVFLLPDNDNAGWEHINKVGTSLSTIAKGIRVVSLPGLAAKGDVIDWARAGGTREQLDALLAEAPIWQSPRVDELPNKKSAATAEDELLNALAKMPKGINFGRERKRLKKELGVSYSDIDAEVEARRVEAETAATATGMSSRGPSPSTATR
jgi:DNA primase